MTRIPGPLAAAPAPLRTTPTRLQAAGAAAAAGAALPARRSAQPGPVHPAPPGPAAPSGPQGRAATVSPARATAIRSWVAQNARAESGWLILHDNSGGSRAAEALRGRSPLGALNAAERDLLARESVAAWSGQDGAARAENMREAADAVATDPAARGALARALAEPALREQQAIAAAGSILTSPDAAAAAAQGLEQALRLDAGAVLRSFEGLEPQLARLTQERPDQRAALWQALGRGSGLSAQAQERMTSALFVFEDGAGVADAASRDGFARAIASARRPGEAPADRIARDQIAADLKAALGRTESREMILGRELRPELRLWALDRAAGDGACRPDPLAGGWEGDTVSRAFATEVNAAFRARGTAPQQLSGEALRNTVGQAMGITPDRLPQGELGADFLARGMNNSFYSRGGANAGLDRVADRIRAIGGENARVTVVPVTVTSDAQGAAVVPVFRVETGQGPRFVDHTGRSYADLADWQQHNTLPEGRMTYAEGLDLRSDRLTHGNTPAVTDSFAEVAGKAVDGLAIAGGVVAGVAMIAGSGGMAAPLVAGGAGLWMAGRAGQQLHDMNGHGQDIGDLGDPAVRGAWLEAAGGVLSVGAIGGAMRLGSAGARVSPALARAVGGVGMAAEATDVITLADQSVQLGRNWDRMSGGERAGALLNIAFWGGMTGASHMAGHGGQQGFAGIDQRIRMGAGPVPEGRFPVVRGAEGVAPGEIRVAYDMQGGRPANIRILTGSASPDPVRLAQHMRVADQMQKAGGLSDRLRGLLGGQEAPPVGSSAWEARLEIDKITAESRALAADAARAGSADEQARIATRQRELDQAILRETRRLDGAAVDGRGFVAAPKSLDEIMSGYVARGDVIAGVPADLPPLAAPAAGAPGRIDYGRLNERGQALGIEATITRKMLDTGSTARSSIRPPGFVNGQAENHSRGHLLARMLGGSGSVEENLVTLYQQDTNSPVMSDFERLVYEAVDAGETVNYRVTPIYQPGNPMPVSVALQARGDQGLSIDVTIVNRDGR